VVCLGGVVGAWEAGVEAGGGLPRGMEALCRAFPRGQNLQPMSSSDHFPARNRLPPKSVRIQETNLEACCSLTRETRGRKSDVLFERSPSTAMRPREMNPQANVTGTPCKSGTVAPL